MHLGEKRAKSPGCGVVTGPSRSTSAMRCILLFPTCMPTLGVTREENTVPPRRPHPTLSATHHTPDRLTGHPSLPLQPHALQYRAEPTWNLLSATPPPTSLTCRLSTPTRPARLARPARLHVRPSRIPAVVRKFSERRGRARKNYKKNCPSIFSLYITSPRRAASRPSSPPSSCSSTTSTIDKLQP